jgi:hypothetical protein
MLPAVNTGGVLSIRVLYATEAELPAVSVTVTVMVALQVPLVDAVFVKGPGQLSVAVVAAMAAACAAAAVGKQAAMLPAVTIGG